MNIQLFLGGLFITSAVAVQTSPEEDFYHVAVVEYSPLDGKDGEEILQKNGDVFVRHIKEAAKTADIVVFPEIAINYNDLTVFVDIPSVKDKVAPADNPNLHPVLRSLSKAARDNEIYVAFTIHEKDETSGSETLKYNTGLVLDRNGTIVLKYRKFNLFNEPMNVTKVPDIAYFDSDFGVRFGMFICFDIMFRDPPLSLLMNGVTDVIYPSWWFSLFPSGFSTSTQMSWAYLADVNLLAAGVNSMKRGSTGSGIYAGRKGPVVYIFSERNETRILTAKLFKKGKQGQSEGNILEPLTPGVDSDLKLYPYPCPLCETYLLTPELKDNSLKRANDPYDNSKHIYVLNQKINKKICQGTLCCKFDLDMSFTYKPKELLDMSDSSYARNDSFYHYQYRLNVFNGEVRVNGSTQMGTQVCGIIPCLSDSLSSCTPKSGKAAPLQVSSDAYGDIFLHSTKFNDILIKAASQEKVDSSVPIMLESSKSDDVKAYGSLPHSSRIKFHIDKAVSSLKFSSDRLIYAGINARIFSRDDKTSETEKSSLLRVEL